MKKWKISSFMGLMAVLLGLLSGCERKSGLEFYEMETAFETDAAIIEEVLTETVIYVDVCGAVYAPGVYTLLKGERAFRAIELAGGMLPEADEAAVNQAALLEDAQQLYVPFEGALDDRSVAGSDGRVNLNTASEEELMTIPGIGASRAEAILDYREEHGGFSAIEEIKNISGIGDAVFEKMKDKIKV